MKNFKIIFIFFIAVFIFAGCNTRSGDNMDYDEVKELIEEHKSDKKGVRGSCNLIAAKSSCVDFIGSVFSEERMKLSCTEGIFSKNTCPYTEIGGCQAGAGTLGESIVWSYSSGGDPMSAENAKYAAMACNKTGVSKWVTPDSLLNNN